MRVEWIREEERFAALEPAWEELAGAHGLPFLRHAWFAAWWRAFAAGRQLAVLALWDGGELAGVFPLCGRDGRLEPMENDHTPIFRPLARDDGVRRVLLEVALRAARGALRLRRLPADGPTPLLLAEVSEELGRLALVQPEGAAPFVDTSGEREAWWRGRSRKTRKDLRNRRNHLDSLPDLRVEPLAVPEDIEAELAAGLAVEGSGWKTERGTAIANSQDVETFYRELALSFAAPGRLRFSTLAVDRRVIGFDFVLVDHGSAWTLKGGYDPAYARYAPGLLLTLAQVEECFALGLRSLELLGDRAPWKLKFTSEARPYCWAHSYPRTPAGLVGYAYQRHAYPRLRRLYRRLPVGRARG